MKVTNSKKKWGEWGPFLQISEKFYLMSLSFNLFGISKRISELSSWLEYHG